jgi:hypothetical protein
LIGVQWECMNDEISRREFVRRAGVGLAAVAAGALVHGQVSGDDTPDPAFDALEKKLAKPLSEEARKLTRASMRSNVRSAVARDQHRLPENSEPCFVYLPTPHEGKAKR